MSLRLMIGLLSFTIVLQSDLNQRKLAVNKFTWRQYKRFELLGTSGRFHVCHDDDKVLILPVCSVADEFGVLIEGQCELLKGPAAPTVICPQAVAPTLMRRSSLTPLTARRVALFTNTLHVALQTSAGARASRG